MKVCLISPHFPTMSYPCGAADFTLGLAKSLSKKYSVSVLTANDKTVSTSDIRIHTIPGPWNLRAIFKLAYWIRKERFDIIDIQFEAFMYGRRGAILLIPLLLPGKIKKIITLHSETLPIFGGRLWRLVQMVFFDQVIFYSEQFLNNTRTRFKRAEKKFSLTPFPANISRYPDTTLKTLISRHFKGYSGHSLYLSYFGHISENRGIEFLISAMELLKQENIHLIFIGQFDPSKNPFHRDISALVKSKDLSSFITFTGRLDEKEVSQVISISDAAVLPFHEGASFKNGSLAAYASHHTPVFTTRSQLTEEVLCQNEGLRFFDLNKPSSLVNAVIELKNDPALLSHMRISIGKLDELYSWENYREQRQLIYEKTCT